MEARKKATQTNPDLILLNIIMPKKDGFAVLTDLNADPATVSTPVIILSNLGQDEDIRKAKALTPKTTSSRRPGPLPKSSQNQNPLQATDRLATVSA